MINPKSIVLVCSLNSTRIRLLLIWVLLIINIGLGFSQNDRDWSPVVKKHALSINIAGTTPIIGFTYEYLLSTRFSVEVGLGIYSVGAALKFFPLPVFNNKMVPHIVIGSNLFTTPFDTFGSGDFSNTTYLNFGLSYFGKDGFNFGLSIGPSINYDFEFDELTKPIYGNLKLGYRF